LSELEKDSAMPFEYEPSDLPLRHPEIVGEPLPEYETATWRMPSGAHVSAMPDGKGLVRLKWSLPAIHWPAFCSA
jgi:hypothetical protein